MLEDANNIPRNSTASLGAWLAAKIRQRKERKELYKKYPELKEAKKEGLNC